MPRPLKTALDFFQHDTGMSADPGIEALESIHGNDGYAVYCKLLERIYLVAGKLDLSDEVQRLSIVKKCNVPAEKFDSIVADAVRFKLFDREIWESENKLTSRRIREQLGVVENVRNKWRGNEAKNSKSVDNPRNEELSTRITPSNGELSTEITPKNESYPRGKVHRVEESRGEKRRGEDSLSSGFPVDSTKACRQASSAREESAPVAPLPACLPEFAQGIKNQVLKAPWRTSFTDTDYLAFSGNLTAKLTDLGFVEYAIRKIAADRSVKNPAGLLKTQLLDGAAWIDEYTWEPEKGPKTWSSAAPDPEPDAPLMSSSQLAEIKARVTGKREKAGAA